MVTQITVKRKTFDINRNSEQNADVVVCAYSNGQQLAPFDTLPVPFKKGHFYNQFSATAL